MEGSNVNSDEAAAQEVLQPSLQELPFHPKGKNPEVWLPSD